MQPVLIFSKNILQHTHQTIDPQYQEDTAGTVLKTH